MPSPESRRTACRRTGPPPRGIQLCVFLWLLLSAGAAPVRAEPAGFDEYAVKAGFVYNFAKFVEWPAEAFRDEHSPLLICIVGRDPFGSRIDLLANKTVAGRKLAIKRLGNAEGPERCQILFVGKTENDHLPALLKADRHRALLTIGESPLFCRAGGIINLFPEGDKLRFEISSRNAEKTRLKISSQLLNLARPCREESP